MGAGVSGEGHVTGPWSEGAVGPGEEAYFVDLSLRRLRQNGGSQVLRRSETLFKMVPQPPPPLPSFPGRFKTRCRRHSL